jgi:hypothetical protein
MKLIVLEEKDFAEIVRFCMSVNVSYDSIEAAYRMKEALKSAKELKDDKDVDAV